MRRFLEKQLKYISLLILIFGLWVIISDSNYHLPGNNKDYQPRQPLKFSHRLHSGEMNISCLYCHYGAETSRHAGIPAVNICMNCHKFITASSNSRILEEIEAKKAGREIRTIFSPEILKIYTALGLDKNLKKSGKKPESIKWVKVHRVPDYVYFSHKPHLAVGVECRECHGEVETMEIVKQVSDLSMGWCLDCHRKAGKDYETVVERTKFLSDCNTCHY